MSLEFDKKDKLLWVIPKSIHKFMNTVLFREDPKQPICVPIYDVSSDTIIFSPLIKAPEGHGEYRTIYYQRNEDGGYPEVSNFGIYNHDGLFCPLVLLDRNEWVRLQESPHRAILSYIILCWIPYTDLLLDPNNQLNVSEGYKKLIWSDMVELKT